MDSLSRRSFVASVVAGSALTIGQSSEADDVWTPPENPDPSKILDEAQDDTQSERYEVALAKHVWYHENALKIQPAQYGVRLSFALSYWMDLAEQYPPALETLKSIRDEAAAKVIAAPNAPDVAQTFHDVVAINRKLEEDQQVRELFKTLHKDAPQAARSVYNRAEPALIRGREYKLCGDYLEPDRSVPRIIESYEHHRESEKRLGPHHRDYTEKNVTNEAATLVGLLAVNDRDDEAKDAAGKLKTVWNDKQYHAAIDKALTGNVPDPWPEYQWGPR